ncbi:voltage-dependent anion channel-domain-containing protein [Phaeosphaeria sp. MPI-PUGE-AT-0046c]|nr:voltage-dependent anion channel-domain-containing protein [Phaeosphaeria sp. MPI-PUGE-AT-0046c]
MDTRYQPEGLSFDNRNNFGPNVSNGGQAQYTMSNEQQRDQYDSQARPQESYSPLAQNSERSVPPPGTRAMGMRSHGPFGLPSGPRLSDSVIPYPYRQQRGSQSNDYPRDFEPRGQQTYQQQGLRNAYNPQRSGPSPMSGETTRTNTWAETPSASYSSAPAYFSGPVDANGYPLDIKDKGTYTASTVKETLPSPKIAEVSMHVVDLEKDKHDAGHGHGGWDYHSKIPHQRDPNQPYMPYGQRLRHFTWAWYTLTMATGGIATLLSIQPHPFRGLISIGAAFYIINLIFFFGISSAMMIRFIKFPGAFKDSIMHEREGLFLGPFFLSVATIITGTQKYVIEAYQVDHPNRTFAVTIIAVAFWVYTFAAFCLAVFQYSFLFCCHTYKLTSFMPSWLLPVFPIMLAGTIASVIAPLQPLPARMPIIAAGLGCQGLGFTMAIIMYAHYIGRLMQVGYPGREHRGAMFIGVGPPSFTCLALIGMANALPDDFDIQGDGLIDAKVFRTLAIVVALFLWVLAMWFFMITLVAVCHSWAQYFHLGWWAMVFPNTGFVIATISIGNALKDETILYVANGLTIAILVMWFYVLFNHVQAVIVGDIMYPMMDEDNADH